MSVTADTGASNNQGWKQFAKFCLIGATSAVIDIGVGSLLWKGCGLHWRLAYTISFLLAVTNGYIWNSLWTFRGLGATNRRTQYLKFVAVNTVGYLLNTFIMSMMITLMTGHINGDPSTRQLGVAKGVAIVLVSGWNFLANKRWTFAAARA